MDRMLVWIIVVFDLGVLEKGYDNMRRILESLSLGVFVEVVGDGRK